LHIESEKQYILSNTTTMLFWFTLKDSFPQALSVFFMLFILIQVTCPSVCIVSDD